MSGPHGGSLWLAEMGRPLHEPEPFLQRQVEAMAGYGIPETDIAQVLKVDPARNLVAVKGAVPGPRGGLVLLKKVASS